MFKKLFTPKWSKWEKIGDEKIIKINYSSNYDPVWKEWIGRPIIRYYLVQEYTRNNRKTGLDQRKEVFVRQASQEEYRNFKNCEM